MKPKAHQYYPESAELGLNSLVVWLPQSEVTPYPADRALCKNRATRRSFVSVIRVRTAESSNPWSKKSCFSATRSSSKALRQTLVVGGSRCAGLVATRRLQVRGIQSVAQTDRVASTIAQGLSRFRGTVAQHLRVRTPANHQGRRFPNLLRSQL